MSAPGRQPRSEDPARWPHSALWTGSRPGFGSGAVPAWSTHPRGPAISLARPHSAARSAEAVAAPSVLLFKAGVVPMKGSLAEVDRIFDRPELTSEPHGPKE
ncbi:hypothetical protein GCM10010440_27190 [Kitasatospora cinereorecta]